MRRSSKQAGVRLLGVVLSALTFRVLAFILEENARLSSEDTLSMAIFMQNHFSQENTVSTRQMITAAPERLMITDFSHSEREEEQQEQRRKEVMSVLRGPNVSETERRLHVAAMRSQFSLFARDMLDKQNKLDGISPKK